MKLSPATWFASRGLVPVPLLAAQLWYGPPGIAHPWVFVGLVGGGELIRLWAAGNIGRRSRTNDSSVGELVTSGPYAVVRNPLYIANTLQWVGLGAAAGIGWCAAWCVLGIGLYSRLVPWEEEQLRAAWPMEFQRWSGRVRRWWPKWPIAVPTASHFSLRTALRSERSTLWVWMGITLLLVLR